MVKPLFLKKERTLSRNRH